MEKRQTGQAIGKDKEYQEELEQRKDREEYRKNLTQKDGNRNKRKEKNVRKKEEKKMHKR